MHWVEARDFFILIVCYMKIDNENIL
jgi:hypothetical protein